MIVKNGVGLEKWFDDTIKSAEPKGTIVDASRVCLPPVTRTLHNPQNAKIMVRNIAKAFEAACRRGEHVREEQPFSAKLDSLDADIKCDSTLNKKLVTNHDTFGYYVEHFGLDFVGSVIPSFDSRRAFTADISDLVAKIRRGREGCVLREFAAT